MDPEGITLLSLLTVFLFAAFALFGVVVVQRSDPSPHAVLLGCHGLAIGAMFAIAYRHGFPSDGMEFFYGLTLAFTTLQLVWATMGWALAAAVRPGDDAVTTSRAWLHTGIVAAGTVATGIYASSPLYVLWWFPGVMHIVLAYRDSPRLRQLWGVIASIASSSVLAWLAGALLQGNFEWEVVWLLPALLAHHGLALAQARTARPTVAIWPLLGLVAYRLSVAYA